MDLLPLFNDECARKRFSWIMLPGEIWLEIFKFLPQPVLLYVIRKVCHKFKIMVFDPVLWKRIDMNVWKNDAFGSNLCVIQNQCLGQKSCSSSVQEDIMDCLERKQKSMKLNSCDLFSPIISYVHQSVKEISFSRYFDDFTFGIHEQNSLHMCSNLTYLDVGFCENINTTTLRNICYYCPKLHTLILESCGNITDDTLEVVSRLCYLKKLDISHCAAITDIGIHFLSLMNCCLKHFISDGVLHITDVGIIDLVCNQKELETLVIDGEELTDVSVVMATCTLTHLKAFQVSFCTYLTEKSVLSIKGKNRLEVLRLRKLSDNISSLSIKLFFLHQPLHYLKHLALTDSSLLTDDTLHAIAQSAPMLEHLQLDWCTEITDNGICFLTNKCMKLKQLLLVGLARLEGIWLSNIADKLPHLELLDLSVCNLICDEELYKLLLRSPNLIAYSYFHEKLDITTVKSMCVCPKLKPSSAEQPTYSCAGSQGATVDF